MKIVGLDFETGGLDARTCGPVSIGLYATDTQNPGWVETYESLIRPATKKNSDDWALIYDVSALKISGVTVNRLLAAPPESQVYAEISAFCKQNDLTEAMIVSHNAEFDQAFWSQFLYRQGQWIRGSFCHAKDPLRGAWFCTKRAASDLSMRDRTLDTVALKFGLSRSSDLHGALEDAKLAVDIYLKMRGSGR